MIINTIIRLVFLVAICFVSYVSFNKLNLTEVQEELAYINMEVVQNKNAFISVDDFSNEEQLTINLINESNTSENYNILLTSNINLEEVDEYLYIKINNKSYILEDLFVKNNYYRILKGEIKASSQQIKIYLAVNNEYSYLFKESVGFNFINENTLI